MFVDRRQQPNARYDRDQCISCLLRLGWGLDRLSRHFRIDRSIVARITSTRITTTRYTGFDREWASLRVRSTNARRTTQQMLSNWVSIHERDTLDALREDCNYWERYDSMYARRYREWTAARKAKRKKFKNKVKNDPLRYAAYMENERRNNYRRKGVPEHEIPDRGTYTHTAKLTKEQQRDMRRIRRKREYLRKLVREVWRGEVGDAAAFYRVGCSVEEFRNWVGMRMLPAWNEANYGKTWNFDHIRPCAAFDVFDRASVKRLNHYTNLRPCCAMENSLKGSNC